MLKPEQLDVLDDPTHQSCDAVEEEEEGDDEEWLSETDTADEDDYDDGWEEVTCTEPEPVAVGNLPLRGRHSPSITLVSVESFVKALHQLIDKTYVDMTALNEDVTYADVFQHVSADGWKFLLGNIHSTIRSCLAIAPSPNASPASSPSPDADLHEERVCEICDTPSGMSSKDAAVFACQHVVCADCWRQHMSVYISGTMEHMKIPNPYIVKCPCLDCGEQLSGNAFRLLVLKDTSMYAVYVRALLPHLKFSFESERAVKFCHNSDCNMMAYDQDNEDACAATTRDAACKNVDCECGYQWCFSCNDATIGSHFPFSCAQVQSLAVFGRTSGNDGANLFSVVDFVHAGARALERSAYMNYPLPQQLVDTMLCVNRDTSRDVAEVFASLKFDSFPSAINGSIELANFAICPSCKIVIEKTGGCSLMTCRCGHAFCWACLNEEHVGPCFTTDTDIAKKTRNRSNSLMRRFNLSATAVDKTTAFLHRFARYYSDNDNFKELRTIVVFTKNFLHWGRLYSKLYARLVPRHENPVLYFMIDHTLAILQDEMDHALSRFQPAAHSVLMNRLIALTSLFAELES